MFIFSALITVLFLGEGVKFPLIQPGDCGMLTVDAKGTMMCPNCRRKIRRIRAPLGCSMQNVDVQCADCKATFIVNIDQASAIWKSPRH